MKKLTASLALTITLACTTFQTNFQNTAGKFLSTTAATVDAAMHGWAVWVNTGKATPQDEATVKSLYQQYQTYMMVATNTYTLAIKLSDPTVFTVPSNNLFTVRTTLVNTTTKQ